MALTGADAPAGAWVSVRAFCALIAKAGDLDLRFTPAPSAIQGMAGHRAVAARRGPDYRSEVPIAGIVNGLGLRGRIDGLFEDPPRLEEIKTFRGAIENLRDNHRALHCAQLKTYGALYCRQHGLAAVDLQLVYFEIGSGTEHPERQTLTAAELDAFLEAGAARYQAWEAEQLSHRKQRDAALRAMAFPHRDVPAGQRTLMRAVASALDAGVPLLAQAPTGVGKTIGTLFPALQALGAGTIDKVFYLTAKTSGRREAVKAIQSLGGAGKSLRVLELTARAKACEHPDKACHGDACPLANGFYDRLPGARDAAQHAPHLGPMQLRELGASHRVCPYYLSQEMVRWSDVVIGDVNYYFDQSALLYALTQENNWRIAVLTDEAHNLIDRGRDMYSATISQSTLRALTGQAPTALTDTLANLERAWTALLDDVGDAVTELAEPPQSFRDTVATAAGRVATYLAEDPTRNDPKLLACYFELLGFLRLAETFGAHSFCDLERHTDGDGLFGEPLSRLLIRNVLPAPHLAPRLQAAHSVIAFSATLAPMDFYRQMLGFSDDVACCDAPSAFAAEQLDVQLITRIPTTYRHRNASALPIAQLIAEQYHRRPGNYLVFLSSFAYLNVIADAFSQQHGPIPSLRQSPAMTEGQRSNVLSRLGNERGLVVFAVLGGVFAESVDLAGEQLIGAFVATIGLPPMTPHNDRMAARLDTLLGDGQGKSKGRKYTYDYPGLRKVIQAAGRIIRSPNDQGTLHLIDARYARAEIRALLPHWWDLSTTSRRFPRAG